MDKKYINVGSAATKAIEECSELIHIICKAERFGLDNYHPQDKEKTPNSTLILREVEDVENAINNLKKYILATI